MNWVQRSECINNERYGNWYRTLETRALVANIVQTSIRLDNLETSKSGVYSDTGRIADYRNSTHVSIVSVFNLPYAVDLDRWNGPLLEIIPTWSYWTFAISVTVYEIIALKRFVNFTFSNAQKFNVTLHGDRKSNLHRSCHRLRYNHSRIALFKISKVWRRKWRSSFRSRNAGLVLFDCKCLHLYLCFYSEFYPPGNIRKRTKVAYYTNIRWHRDTCRLYRKHTQSSFSIFFNL